MLTNGRAPGPETALGGSASSCTAPEAVVSGAAVLLLGCDDLGVALLGCSGVDVLSCRAVVGRGDVVGLGVALCLGVLLGFGVLLRLGGVEIGGLGVGGTSTGGCTGTPTDGAGSILTCARQYAIAYCNFTYQPRDSVEAFMCGDGHTVHLTSRSQQTKGK